MNTSVNYHKEQKAARVQKVNRAYAFTSLFFLLVCFSFNGFAQANLSPAPAQDKGIVLMGGTAHIGDGRVIENSAVGFKDGKITFVADATVIRIDGHEYRSIDASGKHIYPAFFALYSNVGLNEIGAVRATHDYNEVGDFTPEVRSIIAYNTDSRVVPTLRSNGLLYAQVVPLYGVLPGTSSIVQLDAWNWEDAAVLTDDAVHLNWERIYSRNGWWVEQQGEKAREKYESGVAELYDYFEQAEAYANGDENQPVNLAFESMRGLFDGTKKCYIQVIFDKEIIEAIAFARHFGLDAVLVGARDAWMLTDLIKESGYPVVLLKTHKMPGMAGDPIFLPYEMPALLEEAGIEFALSLGAGWDDFYNLRNLPFQAGTAVAYGLDYEKAIESITLAPARIAGLDHRFGSLESGKDASIIVSEGDVLDMRTSVITQAFIEGREIDLNDKQKQLYRKYSDKYGLEVK